MDLFPDFAGLFIGNASKSAIERRKFVILWMYGSDPNTFQTVEVLLLWMKVQRTSLFLGSIGDLYRGRR